MTPFSRAWWVDLTRLAAAATILAAAAIVLRVAEAADTVHRRPRYRPYGPRRPS